VRSSPPEVKEKWEWWKVEEGYVERAGDTFNTVGI